MRSAMGAAGQLPGRVPNDSFSSLVHSLLPKDTLLRTYLTSLQLVTGTVWRR